MNGEDVAFLLVLYCIAGGFWFAIRLIIWGDSKYDSLIDQRRAARLVLATPIWPVPLVLVIIRGLSRLTRSLVADATGRRLR